MKIVCKDAMLLFSIFLTNYMYKFGKKCGFHGSENVD